MYVSLINLFQYKDDTILYLFLFIDGGYGYSSLHFNIYNNNEKNKLNDIILEKDNNQEGYSEDPNYYKIYEFKKNEFIITSLKAINIIDIFHWQIIKTINLPKKSIIYNSYCLNNFDFLIFFNTRTHRYRDDSQEKNNMMIIKIKDNYNEIIFKTNLNTEKNGDLFFNAFNQDSIISIQGEKINFYEIIDGVKKNITLELNKPFK